MAARVTDGTWKTPAGGSGTSWLAGDLVYIEGKSRDNYAFQFSLKQRQASVSLKPIR